MNKFRNASFCWMLALLSIQILIISAEILSANGRILNTGDYSWPIRFDRFFELTSSTLDDSYGFGNPASRQHSSMPFAALGYLASLIGIDSSTFQRISLAAPILLSGYGCVLFGKLLYWPSQQRYIFAVLYLVSSISYSYWSPDHGQNFFAYYMFPMVMALCLKYVKEQNALDLVILFACSLNPSFSNPIYLFVYLLAVASLMLLTYRNEKICLEGSWVKVTTCLLVIIVSNLYWIVPFILEITLQFDMASNKIAGLASDYEVAKGDSLNFITAVTGNGGGFWVAGAEFAKGEPYRLWGNYSRTLPFLYLNALVTILCLLYSIGQFNKSRNSQYLILMFFLLVFIISGLKLHRPFSLPAELFLKLPGFGRGFRSIYMKFGFMLAFYWAALLSYSIDFSKSKISNTFIKFYTLFIILLNVSLNRILRNKINGKFLAQTFVCILYSKRYLFIAALYILVAALVVPHALGLINRTNGDVTRPPDYIGIPHSYFELKKLSTNQNGFGAPLALLNSNSESYNIWLDWGKHNGFIGSDFLRTIYGGPVVSFNDGSKSFAELEIACSNISVYCIDYLRSIGFKYLMVRKDLAEELFKYKNIDKIRWLQNNSNKANINIIIDNNNFALFEIYNASPNSRLWAVVSGKMALNKINSSIIHYKNDSNNSTVQKVGRTESNWSVCQNDMIVSSWVDLFSSIIHCSLGRISNVLHFEKKPTINNIPAGTGYLIYNPYYGFFFGSIISVAFFILLVVIAAFKKVRTYA